jgi:anti-sigma-K factor RskA
LVGEYFILIEDLSRKRRRGFAKRFQDAQDLRASLDERSGEITDYINWYQANESQSEPVSDVVHRLPPAEPAARRNDAISRYLDSVEQRGW